MMGYGSMMGGSFMGLGWLGSFVTIILVDILLVALIRWIWKLGDKK